MYVCAGGKTLRVIRSACVADRHCDRLHTSIRAHPIKGFPKRPLSAYNFFFKEERRKVLHLDFQNMGKVISARWKELPQEDRVHFEELAKVDYVRYKKEVGIFENKQALLLRGENCTFPGHNHGNTGAQLKAPPTSAMSVCYNRSQDVAFGGTPPVAFGVPPVASMQAFHRDLHNMDPMMLRGSASAVAATAFQPSSPGMGSSSSSSSLEVAIERQRLRLLFAESRAMESLALRQGYGMDARPIPSASNMAAARYGTYPIEAMIIQQRQQQRLMLHQEREADLMSSLVRSRTNAGTSGLGSSAGFQAGSSLPMDGWTTANSQPVPSMPQSSLADFPSHASLRFSNMGLGATSSRSSPNFLMTDLERAEMLRRYSQGRYNP